MDDDENETWLLEATDPVIEKKVATGYASLTPRERLLYCLWVADYGMRNAGDLTTAADVFSSFLSDGRSAAVALGFPCATGAFSLSCEELERNYFELFNDIVSEIRTA